MDDGLRGRRLLLSARVAATLVTAALTAMLMSACAAPEPLAPVGSSRIASAATHAKPTPSAAPVSASPIPSDFRMTFAKLNRTRFASQGHLADRFFVDVYANDLARTLVGSGQPMPPGAMLVKDAYERTMGKERPAGLFAMQKTDAGTWRWMLVDASGRITRAGAIGACASCHAQAPVDSVFDRFDSAATE